jgi:hypothetical protein
MDYRLSTHALARISERGIPDSWLQQVLRKPEQIFASRYGREIRQSVFDDNNGKQWLLRAVVERDLVVTAMLTSKIDKYRGAP